MSSLPTDNNGIRAQYDPWTIATAIAITVISFLKIATTPALPPLDYPFKISFDSWEWLVQALSYLGEPVTDYHRPPLFSGIFALVHAAELERYAGFIPQSFGIILGLSAWSFTRHYLGGRAAFLATLLILCNKQLFMMSYFLNGDMPCIALIAASYALALRDDVRSRLAAWTCLALSFYAQNAFFAPLCFLILVARHDGAGWHRSARNLGGAATYLLLITAYFVLFFDHGASQIRHFHALTTAPGGLKRLLEYPLWTIASLGAAGTALALAGIPADREKRAGRRDLLAALLAWGIPPLLFFGFWFDRRSGDPRYVAYYLPPLLILAAAGLDRFLGLLRQDAWRLTAITTAALLANCSGGEHFKPHPSPLILTPVHVYDSSTGTIMPSSPMPALWALATTPADMMRSNVAVPPESTADMAQTLGWVIPARGSFSVLPNTGTTSRLAGGIEYLSRRRYLPFMEDTPRDPSVAGIVFFDSTAGSEQQAYEQAMKNALGAAGFAPVYRNHPFTIFLRRKTS